MTMDVAKIAVAGQRALHSYGKQMSTGRRQARLREDQPSEESGTRSAAAAGRKRQAEERSAAEIAAIQLKANDIIASGVKQSGFIGRRPRERRQQLSMFVREMTKPECEIWAGVSISATEWADARGHALWPGRGEPLPEVKHTRCKFDQALLIKLLRYLERDDNLQRWAFGQKLIELSSGDHAFLAATERLRTLDVLVTDFLQELDGQLHDPDLLSLPAGSQRCTHCEGSSGKGRQCRKAAGHSASSTQASRITASLATSEGHTSRRAWTALQWSSFSSISTRC